MGPISTPVETERYIEDNQEYFFMTVKVPDDLASGDTFQVQVERESDDDPEFPPVEVTVPDGVEGGQMVRVQYTTGLPARPSDGAEWTDGAGEAGAEDLEEEEVDSGEAATDAGDGSAEESQLSPEQRDLWLRLEALPGITDAPLALRHELWQAYEWDRRGDYAQAVATLQALLRHSEATHADASPVLANANRLLGMLWRDRSPPEAVAAFTAALELAPTSAFTYGELGQALEVAADAAGVADGQQGAAEEVAAAEATEVGGVSGDDDGAEAAAAAAAAAAHHHHQEATPPWAAGGYEALMVRAAEAYGHAAALWPTDAGAHAALGRVEQTLGRTDGASSALHTAVALSPTDPLNVNELGVFLHTSHRHPEALLRFEAALALETAAKLPVLRHNYAHSLLMNRRHWLPERDDEAAEYLRRALRLMPRHGESYRMLAGLRQDEMRWGEATALARQAVALLPSDVEAHQTLATALGGPDGSSDWRGRMLPAATAEEAMHHYRRGLQLEADRDDEPASLVVEQAPNETSPSPDGTFVQFYGELGGAKGSLPEVDQNLAGRERWDAVAGPPDDGYNWADGTAMLHASLIALLFSVLSLVGGCIMLRSLLVPPPERQGRNR